MDFQAIAQMLIGKWPIFGIILSVLGALVVVGQTFVAITPSQNDDAAWEKLKAMPVIGQIISLLSSFAPIQKK
jgi:hypothetical protein